MWLDIRICPSIFFPLDIDWTLRVPTNGYSGARKGITGKFGEKPTRSRHCKWEATSIKPLDELPGKVGGSVEGLTFRTHKPGNLPEDDMVSFSPRGNGDLACLFGM